MCLTKIVEQYDPSLQDVTAWGVFDEVDGELCLPIFPLRLGKKYAVFTVGGAATRVCPTETWLEANKVVVNSGPRSQGPRYLTGFHKYATQEGPKKSWRTWKSCLGLEKPVVRQVKLRGVRILGEECGHQVYVADEMFIPKGM